MSTFFNKAFAKSLSFQDGLMWVELMDGRKLGVPLAYFPKLLRASDKQRKKYIISGGGKGLHWEELDEDISVGHLFLSQLEPSINPESSGLNLREDRRQHI